MKYFKRPPLTLLNVPTNNHVKGFLGSALKSLGVPMFKA